MQLPPPELLELDDELLELDAFPPLELLLELELDEELLELEVFPPLLELDEPPELDDELLELLGLPPLLELEEELPVLPPLLELLEPVFFPPLELEEELPVLPPLLELDDELLELELELDEELLELDELLDELLGSPPELEVSPSGAATSLDALFSPPPPQAAKSARSATAARAMRREIRDDGLKRFFMMYSLRLSFGAGDKAGRPATPAHAKLAAGPQDPSGIWRERIHQRFN